MNNEARIDRLELLVESTAKSVEALTNIVSENAATTNAAIATTQASIDGLVQVVTEFSIRTEARLNKIDEEIAAGNARTEARLDKLDEAITAINSTNQNLEHLLVELVNKQ